MGTIVSLIVPHLLCCELNVRFECTSVISFEAFQFVHLHLFRRCVRRIQWCIQWCFFCWLRIHQFQWRWHVFSFSILFFHFLSAMVGRSLPELLFVRIHESLHSRPIRPARPRCHLFHQLVDFGFECIYYRCVFHNELCKFSVRSCSTDTGHPIHENSVTR